MLKLHGCNKELAIYSRFLGSTFSEYTVLFLLSAPRVISGVMAPSDITFKEISPLKNNMGIFRAGMIEEFAAAKSDFPAKLFPGVRDSKVKM